VVAAAEAGKHVFCDKPLAIEVADAERAVDACRQAGVKLGVNFEFRHAQPYRAIRDAVRTGGIGDVLIAQVDSSSGILPHKDWRGDPALAGLGTTFNVGVHLYDVLRFVLDAEVVEVTALFDVETDAGTKMELTSLVLLRFDNGTLAYVNANQVVPKPLNDVVFQGTSGRIESHGLGSLAYLLRNKLPCPPVTITTDGGVRTIEHEIADVFERSIGSFATAIVEDREPDAGGHDGIRSVELAQAIARSARTRTTVQLPATVAA
jgi:1,5-anhydro-D-fructose reductase (1,5-anhydro-D-mannitol-forming)